MSRKRKISLFAVTGALAAAAMLSKAGLTESRGEKEKKGMPPALVVVSQVKTGMLSPYAEFTGSVYFSQVSDLSSEVSGSVNEVLFEEGQAVKQGQTLLKMDSEILEKRMEVVVANYEEARTELEKSQIDLKRIENLYREESVAEQTYDDYRFKVLMFERKTASLQNEVEQLKIELEKKTIRSPFDGVVIKKFADRGEWLDPGVKVATIAKRNSYDIVVDVPSSIISLVEEKMEVEVSAGGKQFTGRVFAIIPMGDISTRTFPVKIRIKTDYPLLEGMEAKASLPEGEKVESLIVPRDAIVTVFGTTAVFTVTESKAQMIPVTVLGYSGLEAGVNGEGLREGMPVVVKGNERLRDGQDVAIDQAR